MIVPCPLAWCAVFPEGRRWVVIIIIIIIKASRL
jgi:hypothetical protein